MKTIRISNHSIYSDGFYTSDESNFIKLYKGVRVNVDYCEDGKYMHFSIRTGKARTVIWKRCCERMDALIFDDGACSITCDFENEAKNNTPHTLSFKEEVYEDLKRNIPAYMKECGCTFETVVIDNVTVMKF